MDRSQVRIQRGVGGGQGDRTPLENHKLFGFLLGISNWTPLPLVKVGPPLEKFGPPPEPRKMIFYFEINHLASVNYAED